MPRAWENVMVEYIVRLQTNKEVKHLLATCLHVKGNFANHPIYYLNLAPTIYYGLKRFAFKARFMILILSI